MQTNLEPQFLATPAGQKAESILRKCVHCGFCTATCPTYQILGDELDSPRGRIYLIKEMLEGNPVSELTRTHLDRCLTCRSCETTCPSGVRYGQLIDIGRAEAERRVPRRPGERLVRALMRAVLPHTDRFSLLLRTGQMLAGLLPADLRRQIPERRPAGDRPNPDRERKMLLLEGCVQPGLAPEINAATARVLDRLGISLITPEGAGCCGAVSYHLGAHDEGLDFMRRNLDAWWPHVEQGVEALVVTASACATQVKEYHELLHHDPEYGPKAARVVELTRDLVEVLGEEDLSAWHLEPRRVAFHAPCTLQHGQGLAGRVEALLTSLGLELTPVSNPHLCCGSAGTYSLLQPELSQRLLANKLEALEAEGPELIATANIGCLMHLRAGATRDVVHWVELLDGADWRPRD